MSRLCLKFFPSSFLCQLFSLFSFFFLSFFGCFLFFLFFLCFSFLLFLFRCSVFRPSRVAAILILRNIFCFLKKKKKQQGFTNTWTFRESTYYFVTYQYVFQKFLFFCYFLFFSFKFLESHFYVFIDVFRLKPLAQDLKNLIRIRKSFRVFCMNNNYLHL